MRSRFPHGFGVALAAMLIALLSSAGVAHGAEQRAVLIGVSAYDNLPPYQHLRGPKNDVTLLRDILMDRGFEAKNIAVIADGVEGGTRPTRAAILKALDDVGAAAARDDFVFVHFSGHGTQQPARRDKRETDGLDEVFLPADTGKWLVEKQIIENSISDDEIGQRLTAIRNRGAFVWAVFDTCHSGTMTRAAASGERARKLEPASLSVPADKLASTTTLADTEQPLRLADDAGGMVAFYAAQSLETTPEMRLPIGSAEAQAQGLFTYNLAKVLATYPQASYRQAAEQVLRNYNILNRYRPTPVFEGNNLDARVFTRQQQDRIVQYPLKRQGSSLQLQAGRLHLLEPGAILAVVRSPTAAADEQIGFIEVVKAGATRSEVRPVKYDETDEFAVKKLPAVAYARLVEPHVDFTLHVGVPAEASNAKLADILSELDLGNDAGPRLKLVPPGETADVYLQVDEDLLLVLPVAADAGINGPRLDLTLPTAEIRADLSGTLTRVARVVNLLRLSEHLPAAGTPARLSARLTTTADGTALPAHEVSVLNNGDELELLIENPGYRPVDVTMLFVDSDYRIGVVYPREAGEINRIEPRGRDRVSAVIDTSETSGRERLLMLAVAAEPGMPLNDFSFLAQDSYSATEANRGGNSPLSMLLREAGFGASDTRGFIRTTSSDLENASMTVLSWQTIEKR